MKIGLQLYSVRDAMEKSIEDTLKEVKKMGYDYVEFAGYFGHSAEEIRSMLDSIGIECVSVHQVYEVFLEEPLKNVDYLKTIGAKYCAVPWMDKSKHKGSDTFDRTVGELEQVARLLKDAGITLLYHNHDFEFERYENKFLLDWLYESIPADLLQTEIDTCWVRYAGYDPGEYILKYKGRSPVIHLKDFVCASMNTGSVYSLIDDAGREVKENDKADNGFMFKPVGYGIQDIPSVLKAAVKAGAEYAIVEQDSSPERPSLESAKMSIDYLKSLDIK